MKRDYYEVLGVSKTASQDEIKRAYRKLVKQWHPDVNKSEDAEKKFKEIQEAYEVLSNSTKRSQYDQFGHDGVGEGMNFGQGYYDMGNFGGLDDVFESLFGNSNFGFSNIFGGNLGNHQRGKKNRSGFQYEDIQVSISLTLEEANEGSEKEIEYSFKSKCSHCNGTGAEGGTFVKCNNCQGTGFTQIVQDSFFGRMVVQQPCQTCSGYGSIPASVCQYCSGKGYVPSKERIKIKVPVGSYDGLVLKFRGDKSPDLYVKINVKQHKEFVRQGNDIFFTTEIPVAKAVLGGIIDIPTLYGRINLKIPSGTQPLDSIKVKGYGTYVVGNPSKKGDMYVKCIVKLPTRLSSKEKEIWKMLDK